MNNGNMIKKNVCLVCGSSDTNVFLEIPNVPVHCNLLWETREEALNAPRSNITLVFCGNCGHIFNSIFDPKLVEYTKQYENSLHFSQCFQSYANELAARLVKSYDLHNKSIIEIGCGKGDFLKLICDMGENKGIGFDPSYDNNEQIISTDSELVTIIKDFYSPHYSNHRADFICCRHVLEHLQYPDEFLIDIRNLIGNNLDTILFFEVPNINYTLEGLGIWDLIYEHVSYFSKNSLFHLFKSCGFEICNLTETYGGQFLCIEVKPNGFLSESKIKNSVDVNMERIIGGFAEKYQAKVDIWRNNVNLMGQSGQKVVLWGGGSKGITFLNIIDINEELEYVIDINPRKEGKFIPVTGQKISAPQFLRYYKPEFVIVMNSIYKGEIQHIIDSLGFTTQLLFA